MSEPTNDEPESNDGAHPETPTGVPPVPGPPPGWEEAAGEPESPISPAILNPE